MSLALFAAYFFGLIYAAVLGPPTIMVYTGAYAALCFRLLPAIWARTRVG